MELFGDAMVYIHIFLHAILVVQKFATLPLLWHSQGHPQGRRFLNPKPRIWAPALSSSTVAGCLPIRDESDGSNEKAVCRFQIEAIPVYIQLRGRKKTSSLAALPLWNPSSHERWTFSLSAKIDDSDLFPRKSTCTPGEPRLETFGVL